MSAVARENPDQAVHAAVERALSKRRGDAEREVEAILDATLRVAERVAPSAPRVADIVAEAGSSNQAFYRYFSGKDQLFRAVLVRGTERLRSYLAHQVEKATDPAEQIEAWILGVLTQVVDRTAARQSRAIVRNLGDRATAEAGESGLEGARALLRDALRAAGSEQVELDTNVVYDLTFATMSRHAQDGTAPSPEECAHLVRFCLTAVGVKAA
ncbi:TetR/AcrR family transcriptional regulator [Streptomyces sp. NPDC020792]|uniref:TetR/AcrR family transcriptional regulator n=1 Tax=Streptomyces sp. NPDC020792 TaxID=3365089 RepID=UPI0037B8F127